VDDEARRDRLHDPGELTSLCPALGKLELPEPRQATRRRKGRDRPARSVAPDLIVPVGRISRGLPALVPPLDPRIWSVVRALIPNTSLEETEEQQHPHDGGDEAADGASFAAG
jgi:hypothetical protein